MLKYPVLLVHGAGFRDKVFGLINYWGRIPKLFLKHGIKVYYGGTDAWGSIEKNAEILKNKITTILDENKTEKINIIAHSRGGLEARYAINNLALKSEVCCFGKVFVSGYYVPFTYNQQYEYGLCRSNIDNNFNAPSRG